MSKRSIRLVAGVGLIAASIVAAAVLSTTARAGADSTYIVVYRASVVPADASTSIQHAGGTLVWSYSQIGVAIAKSSNASFSDGLLKDSRVESAAATSRFGTQLDSVESSAGPSGPLPDATPAPGTDNLSSLQWDMNQIQAPEARAINGGSPSVTVGDIDTGLDYTHPDLAPNVDFANSVSCVGGVPNTDPLAWKDDNGHGTHTAGTIAAAKSGGEEHDRDRRRRAERQDRRDQGGQRGGVLLPGGRRLRVHVGRLAPHRRHQQQLLRRPVALQLP